MEDQDPEDLDSDHEDEQGENRARDKFVTARAYYAYRLQIRPVSDTDGRCYFWLFGRLCQQYVVDQYAKIEAGRLRYVKDNQKKLRSDLYKGIMDALAHDRPASETGKFFVLPSSFAGGPRYMSALYQDAMTMVRHYGKPDLFITFTCNPKWPEIQNELMDGQKAEDRPDLTVRVCHLKLEALLDDLIEKGTNRKKGVLGKVIAYTWVIEFQKRGLPHAHILLILDAASKIKTAQDIDSVVSAEIPDQETCPLAFETVTTSMVHGPCGARNPDAPCMATDNKTGFKYCTKNYPRPLVEETEINNSGYPQYRRRDNGVISWEEMASLWTTDGLFLTTSG